VVTNVGIVFRRDSMVGSCGTERQNAQRLGLGGRRMCRSVEAMDGLKPRRTASRCLVYKKFDIEESALLCRPRKLSDRLRFSLL
jgi:hypothetical protein